MIVENLNPEGKPPSSYGVSKNLIPVAIIIAALIIAGAIVLATMIYVKEAPPIQLPQKEDSLSGISIEGRPVLGNAEAPVTLIEFSDFECPFCARYANDTFSQIKKEYVDTGKVKMVFKHFPLPFHQFAQKAAEAGECAFEQGKFWEYKEILFSNQENLDINSFKKYAQDLLLDTQEFNNCLDSGRFREKVAKDLKEGEDAGVTGTPTFFINGEKLVGAQPFSEFQKTIERKLSE